MPLSLRQIATPEVPLEADNITPSKVADLTPASVEKLTVLHGNETRFIGDFFKASGRWDGTLEARGDRLARVKFIGAGMAWGTLRVAGDAGEHLGAGMSGGDIEVSGDAGDWVGPEMSGGRIEIRGNAGHAVGSAFRGASVGMTGGEIIIHGNARNEAGNGMSGGLIAIGGDSGDFTGVNMNAGSVFVLGEMGIRAGAGMKRGSIVSLKEAELLPTFGYSCAYRPGYLALYLRHLAALGLASVTAAHIHGVYRRYCGDSVELNRGEILLYSGPAPAT